ncbi:MAG: pyridoxamine 5'-phosphate oxidase family protein [Calothrix sp. MO_167.B12]|nr:pyridoxamine 5'-phosphate oxidase family protein [Calothrix sp. MO_167.B12]
MDEFTPTSRTTIKRIPERGTYDRQFVYQVLDEGLVCHIGFAVEGQAYVIPTTYGRVGDKLYIHGSPGSRLIRSLQGDINICVTVTLLDGLVLARSAFHHSMNYRSVVIIGRAYVVEGTEGKQEALQAISEHIVPGRWQHTRKPNSSELNQTLALCLPLAEVSAKTRTGAPVDDEADYDFPVWAGEIPLRLVADPPIDDPRLLPGMKVPDCAKNYTRSPQNKSKQ